MAKKQEKSIKEKSNRGRKRRIESPDEMRERSEQYFIECKEKGTSPNYAGLALALGLSSRTQISEYYNHFPEYRETIDEIKTYIENIQLEKLENKEYATAGIIFNLKCNFGYNDKQSTDETVKELSSSLINAINKLKDNE